MLCKQGRRQCLPRRTQARGCLLFLRTKFGRCMSNRERRFSPGFAQADVLQKRLGALCILMTLFHNYNCVTTNASVGLRCLSESLEKEFG